MNEESQTAVQIRTVRFKKARVEHHFMANGVIERFVVLEDGKMRAMLNQARRTKIESIAPPIIDSAISRRDQWEQAELLAKAQLCELYSRAGKARAAREATAPVRKRKVRKKRLGREIVPSVTTEDAVGMLLFAGLQVGDAPYCIKLFNADGNLQCIEGIDLPRALAVAGVKVGDVIRVIKVAAHRVGIVEQRTGSHGTGKRTRRRSRVVFKITKAIDHDQSPIDQGDGAASQGAPPDHERSFPAFHPKRDAAEG